ARGVRWLLGSRVDALVRASALAVVGNDYLAAYASKAGATRIEVIPSTIDLDRYPSGPSPGCDGPPRRMVIGWIGTPHTVAYLRLIEGSLREVLSAGNAVLHVVGASVPRALADLPSESIAWSESTEVSEIARFDVGLMPLSAGDWEKGKCGYKMLQVM